MRVQASGHPSYLSRESCRRLVVVLLSLLAIMPMIVKSRTSRPKSAPAAFFMPSRFLVSIRGDVRHPGIYELPANPVTDTVIKMAVPVRPIADRLPPGAERLPIVAGEEILLSFPPRSEAANITVRPIPAQQRMVLGIPLDINRMEIEDFDRLPGIGPALAKRIVAYRQSNGGRMRVSDLLNIEGIGEKKYFSVKKFF